MRQLLFAAIALCISPAVFAQPGTAKPPASAPVGDQLGLTCAQILELSSADWVARFSETEKGSAKEKDTASPEQKTIRAIAAYGKCYDARTDHLAASLAKTGAGPLMGARGNFHTLQQALDAFKSKALAATDPPADAVKTVYAQLYEKQFRYEYYRSFAKPPAKVAERAAKGAPLTSLKAAADAGAATSSALSNTTVPEPNAPGDKNPVTMAKNHFGELLDALPEAKEHDLHAAFGDIVGRNQMSESTRLEIYRYAIFLLETPSATPFSAPPF
jgi:hypothetical protein